jgi:hypothetical protein
MRPRRVKFLKEPSPPAREKAISGQLSAISFFRSLTADC